MVAEELCMGLRRRHYFVEKKHAYLAVRTFIEAILHQAKLIGVALRCARIV